MQFSPSCRCCSVPCKPPPLRFCYEMLNSAWDGQTGVMDWYDGTPEWMPVTSPSPMIIPHMLGNLDLVAYCTPSGNYFRNWFFSGQPLVSGRGWYSDIWYDQTCSHSFTQNYSYNPSFPAYYTLTWTDEYYSFLSIPDFQGMYGHPLGTPVLGQGVYHNQFILRVADAVITPMVPWGATVTKHYNLILENGGYGYTAYQPQMLYDPFNTSCHIANCDPETGDWYLRAVMANFGHAFGAAACCPELFLGTLTVHTGQLPWDFRTGCKEVVEVCNTITNPDVQFIDLWSCDDYDPPSDPEPPIDDPPTDPQPPIFPPTNPQKLIGVLSGVASVVFNASEPPYGGGKPYTNRLSGSASIRIAKGTWAGNDEGTTSDDITNRISGEATVIVKWRNYSHEGSGMVLRGIAGEINYPEAESTLNFGNDLPLFTNIASDSGLTFRIGGVFVANKHDGIGFEQKMPKRMGSDSAQSLRIGYIFNASGKIAGRKGFSGLSDIDGTYEI